MQNEMIKNAIEAAGFDDATLTNDQGTWVLTMTRPLPRPAEQAWPWLTEPGRQAQWSPIVFDRVVNSRGPATARENPEDEPVDAEVLEVNPPVELIHRWGDHSMRWTLTPSTGGCLLTMEQRFAEAEAGAPLAGGWHVCLAVLTVTIDGNPVGRVVGDDAYEYDWHRLHDHYAERWNNLTTASDETNQSHGSS